MGGQLFGEQRVTLEELRGCNGSLVRPTPALPIHTAGPGTWLGGRMLASDLRGKKKEKKAPQLALGGATRSLAN